ncbi:MAG: mechanosensitive ion channel [Alphaproteobacteria bacterium]|nr:mechanosensitive ion channel [Alphaproteobacteria bacterium]
MDLSLPALSLDALLLGNPPRDAALAAVVLVAVYVLLRRTAKAVGAMVDRWMDPSPLRDHLGRLARRTGRLLPAAIALDVAARLLVLPDGATGTLDTGVTLALIWQLGLWTADVLSWAVESGGRRLLDRTAEPAVLSIEEESQRLPGAVGLVVQLGVWSFAVLAMLETLGVEVTAVLAGLGVGGVAIALAVQNILGDLFASLSIVVDQPFEVGHFIKVGDDLGTVERIGLKSTRVRALSGEQLIFGNADLLGSRVRNFLRMEERRVVHELRLSPDTPPERLAEAAAVPRAAVEAVEGVRFDRCHLVRLDPGAFVYELVYFALTPDFVEHADRQQAVLVRIATDLKERGLELALPRWEVRQVG